MPPFSTSGFVITIHVTLFIAILILLAVVLGIGLWIWRVLKKVDKSNSQKREISPIEESYLQFIYNVSHEVSNPLQSVQTNLENMADCSPEEIGRWNQYYKIISREIERIFTLTENLRILSRLETVDGPIKRESVNLQSVVEDVIMAQGDRVSAQNLSLEYHGPSRPARVFGDRGHLYQMVINLVDNGIKYSKKDSEKIIIAIRENNKFVQLSVEDEGIGVAEDDLPYIFDTAYRSPSKHSIRKAGSGLGLAIVKRIVDQHGGKIGVKSVVGEGTTVTVELPQYLPAEER